jgi:flagellar biosynthetic protein FliP
MWKVFLIAFILTLLVPQLTYSQPIPIPKINIGIEEAEEPRDVSLYLQILFLLTILTLVPSILVMCTSFVRVIVVLAFVRQALALQMMPPTQVLTALALFITFFIMTPTLSQINNVALQPYMRGEIDFGKALEKAVGPIREFMFRQTDERDIDIFMSMSKLPRPKNPSDVPTYVLIPAFMVSELMTAFKMGVLIFIPFLVIDMVVASTLMSMGMIMLPPVMISLPFKVLLFVLVDGWSLLTRSVILSFF